jgi:hypothetical protein
MDTFVALIGNRLYDVSEQIVHLAIPYTHGLPRDAQIVSLYYVFERNQLQFMAAHPSFDPVPDGMTVPDHTHDLKIMSLKIKTDELNACLAAALMEQSGKSTPKDNVPWEFLGPPPK